MKKRYVKHTFCIEHNLSQQLSALALRKNITKTEIVEAALASLLSPDDEQRAEAAFARRLDRVSRQLDKLAWQSDLTNEAVGLFIRFWLTSNPPLPDAGLKVAQAMGKKRWYSFIEALSKRMALGPKMHDEIQETQRGFDLARSEFQDMQEKPE